MPTARIELGIDGQTLALSIEVPEGPVNPSSVLPLAHELSNTLTNIAVAAQTETVSCTKGCGACCRQLVPISTTEARAIARQVAEMPAARRNKVIERFTQALAALASAGLLDRLRDLGTLRQEDLLPLGLAYFRLGIACPFLEDEACSIHAQRPVICREYLVTSPASECADPSPARVQRIRLGGRVSRALPALEPIAKPSAMPWLPLVRALEWHEQQTAEMPRTGIDLVQSLFGSLTGTQVPPPPALGSAA